MTFFTDPEHIWIAVVVGSGVSMVSATLFGIIVVVGGQRFLHRLEEMHRKAEERAAVREESQDGAMREFRRSLDSISTRLDRRDKKDQGTARALGAMHHRLQRLEGKAL